MGFSRRQVMALGAAGLAAGFGGTAALARPARTLAGRAGGMGAKGRGAGTEAAEGAVPLMYFQWVPLTPDPPGRIVTPGGTYSPVNALIGAGGNSMVVGEGDATLLVDTKNAPYGMVLDRDLPGVRGNMSGHISRLIINTHHHADHTGGNWAFQDRVPILAHANVYDRVKAQFQRYIDQAAAEVRALEGGRPNDELLALPRAKEYLERTATLEARDFSPTRSVREKFTSLKVGTIDVEVHHFGPGHTDNDLVVRLRKYNVVHAGDLLFHGRWPFIDRAGGATTTGWIAALEETIKLCDDETTVVPGHGGITNVAGLRGQVEFFRVAREAVGRAIKDGKGREEVAAMTIDRLKNLEQERLRPMTLGALYDEMTGAEAP